MSTRKSILKKPEITGNKTKKNVKIDEDKNEGFIKIPEPITPRSKANRWTTRTDEALARESVKRRVSQFKRARKNIPALAAMAARQKYNIKVDEEDVINIKKHIPVKSTSISQQRQNETKKSSTPRKGLIPSVVGSVFSFFSRKKGGKGTLKNRRK
jgi:hypothetical protein